jgi:maltose O-acetyltransferase
LPYDEHDVLGEVVIGRAVWVGSRVTILPKTRIGDGAVIQAGAVVSGTVPECAVFGGNPARLIKYRDRERFAQLTAAGTYVNWRP